MPGSHFVQCLRAIDLYCSALIIALQSDLAVAHVRVEAHHVRLHVLRHLGAEPIHHPIDHSAHRFMQVLAGGFQLRRGQDEQRLGLGVGFLVKG
ncbi:hypothetical protein FQZ97_988160 [compost metagenome]